MSRHWSANGVYTPQLGGEPAYPELWVDLHSLWIPGHVAGSNSPRNWVGQTEPTWNGLDGTNIILGNHGWTVDLNGSDEYGALGSFPTLDVGNAWTVACWFRADNTSNRNSLLGKAAANNASHIKLYNNNAIVNMHNGSFYGGTQSFTDTTSWHSIIAVNESSGTGRGYLDGTQMTGTSFDGSWSDGNAYIGAAYRSGAASDFFNGQIASYMIFTRALSEPTVRRLGQDPTYHPMARKPRVPTAKVAAAGSTFPWHYYQQQHAITMGG